MLNLLVLLKTKKERGGKKEMMFINGPKTSKVSFISVYEHLNMEKQVFERQCFLCLLSQGSSWLHVGTDQPFKSISIGAASQVWAIARDGAAFYRGSVSPQNPAGQWGKNEN